MKFSKATINIPKGRFCVGLAVLLLLCAVTAGAQANINPPTTTVQFGGQPNTSNDPSAFTTPRGGIVLYGTAISAITGHPVRHLWVGDNVSGLCRVDPEIDVLGIHSINTNTCPFKLNGLSITGGPMVYDSQTHFLYLVDARASAGLFRLHYLPDGDGGHGNLDFTSIFAMAGNPTGARFQGGQTGCPLPTNSTLPTNPPFGAIDFVSLGPDGNLWVGGKRDGAILRVNNPATASSTGFGTCSDFVQVVATTPDNKKGNGLAWIGHTLWGADGTGPFFIDNADTTCQALGSTPPQTPTCSGNATQLAAAAGAATLNGDQFYPQLNGNNLYFGLGVPGNVVWAGNVAAGPAGQTIDVTFINPAQLPQPPTFPPLGNVGATLADYTDPANIVVYAGEDASTTGALGAGRWWQTCQGTPPAPNAPNCPTPAATAAPGVPTVVRAAAGDGSATVSWSPAQSVQPVTSYTVHTTAADAHVVPDVVVNPAPGAVFPPTFVNIPLANLTSYTFQVSATNGSGTSALSSPSSSTSLPGFAVPSTPTLVSATAGDQAAIVNWTAPANTGGAPITGFTVTAIANHVRTAITVNAGATANSALVTGLTNGTTYQFSVHANNAGGSGMDSIPSNEVVPAVLANSVIMSVAGPSSPAAPPAQVTFSVTISNNTQFPITGAAVTHSLSQVTPDGAYLIIAQPTQGSCTTGGIGQTTIACNIGTLGPLATVKINVIAQIQANAATLTSTFSGTDTGNNPVNANSSFTLNPPPPTSTTDLQITGSAANGGPTVTGTLPAGVSDPFTFQIKDAQNVTANAVVFTNTLPSGNTLRFNSVTLTPAGIGGGSCTGPAVGATSGTITCNIPQFGGGATASQFTVTVNVNVVVAGATINNVATVSFSGTDTNTANNKVTVTIKSK